MSFRLLILIPVGLLLVVALFRVAVGRPLARRTVNTVLALLLLGYFAATAGLGIFWVARQELPVFDLHYLVGYVALLLVVVHVAFNWHALTIFFRRRSPKALLEPGARTWRPALRTAAWAVGLAAYGGVFYWIGWGQGGSRIEITRAPSTHPDPSVAEPVGSNRRAPRYQRRGAETAEKNRKEESSATSASLRSMMPDEPTLRQARPIEQQLVSVEGEEGAYPLAYYYHQQVKHTPASVVRDSRGLNWSTKPDVFKSYPNAKVIDLPPPAEFAGVSVSGAIDACRKPVHDFGADAVTLADVSTMLRMTNGITATLYGKRSNQKYSLRAAPSAGALYPTITYVVAQNVEDLPPGVYHYAVDQHRLHRLRADAAASEQLAALATRSHLVRHAPVTFVFTSAFFRSSWKYHERSYRYCCLDAGHLVVQTSLAAAALGYSSSPIGRFDDAAVNAFLGLSEGEEGTMLLLPVGVVDKVAQAPAGEPEFALAPTELAGRSEPLLLLMHGNTFLSRTGATVRPPITAQPVDKPYPELPVIALPAAVLEGDDLFPTTLRRRSARDWANHSMTLDEFASLLFYAFGLASDVDDLGRDPSVEWNHALNLYVVVNEIDGLRPGVYYYRRHDHALTMIRTGRYRQRSYDASLYQDVVGDAGAALVMTIDVKRLGYPDGDRGYRYAAFDAGMLGGRLYLQATGLDLGCCGIGAFFDDPVGELIGVSPREELVIYMAALGTTKSRAEQ